MQAEGSQDSRLMLDGMHAGEGLLGERVDVEIRRIGERVRFEVAPEVLGIELRRIGRRVEGTDVRLRSKEHLDDARAMRLEPISDEDPGCGQLAVEFSQEAPDTECVDVDVQMNSEVQLHAITCGRDAYRGDREDFLMGSFALLEYGRDPREDVTSGAINKTASSTNTR